MTWYQYIPPVTIVAVLVRVEALFIGPYWAWVELLSYYPDDDTP